MALDDIVPDDKKDRTTRSESKSSPKDDPEKVVIGSGEYRKVFSNEKWEDIKKVLVEEFGEVPNEVVNNYPAQKRHSIIHEAAVMARGEESTADRPPKCSICGNACPEESRAEIEGEVFCPHHPVAKVEKELNE